MTTSDAPELGYRINDADNHFNEPPDCFERYIDPKYADLAIRSVTGPDGRADAALRRQAVEVPLPIRSPSPPTSWQKMLGDTSKIGTGRGTVPQEDEGEPELTVIPGMLLNRLNPLKGLDDEERKAFVAEFRDKSEAFGNRDLRLALMDEQGIDKALMFPAAAHDIEYEFADNIHALYANIRAFNRWMHEEVGFVAENRMFLPPYIAFADPDLAVKELEQVMADGATHHPDQVRARPRRRGQPLRRPLAGRPGLRPVLVHRQRGRASAWPCTWAAPTTRSTGPTGPRTPRRSSATSTPSSG